MESDGSNDEADDTSHTTARPFMFDSTGDHVYIKVSSPAPPDHSLYVSTFLFQFFQASDQNKEGDIDVWLDFFTENATVEMGREERTGNMTSNYHNKSSAGRSLTQLLQNSEACASGCGLA